MNVEMVDGPDSRRSPAPPVPLSARALAAVILLLGSGASSFASSPCPALAPPTPSAAPSSHGAAAAAPLPKLLSETGYLRAGVLEYSPQYPLWSDGARKRRYVSIPPGETIDASDPDNWRFPPGIRFWKEFSFGEKIETRYLEKLPNGSVRFAVYVWDRALGDAVLAPESGRRAVHELGPGLAHDVPSHADCRACHEGRSSLVLGFNALQLSPDRDPLAPHAEPAPPAAIDLRDLAERGLLRGLPAALLTTPPRIMGATPTARAAQGYLFGNCSGCHNRQGPLARLGLDFDQSIAAPSAPSSVGRPSHFRLPGARASRLIEPGHPEQSAVWFRMSVREPSQQMPPLGSKLVDRAGLDLVARFIASSSVNTPLTRAKEK
jgi:hypothetical protein